VRRNLVTLPHKVSSWELGIWDDANRNFGLYQGNEVAASNAGDAAALLQYMRRSLQRGPSQDMTIWLRMSWPIKTSTPAEAGGAVMASTLNQRPRSHHSSCWGSGSKARRMSYSGFHMGDQRAILPMNSPVESSALVNREVISGLFLSRVAPSAAPRREAHR